MTRQSDARRFRFGPPAALGVAGSLRASQVGCLVGGVAGALGAAWVLPVVAAPLALAPLCIGAAGAFVPTPWGVPLIDAARLAAGHTLARRRGGEARWRSLRPESAGLDGEGRVETPRSWGRLRVTGHVAPEGEVGLLVDDAARSVSATMIVRSDALELTGEAERARRVEAFGALLCALATSPERVRRVAWHERTLPAEADAIGQRLAERRAANARPDSVSAYMELIDRATREAVDHECLLTVEADARRAVRRAGETPQGAAGRVAVDALRLVTAVLDDAGIAAGSALRPRHLAQAIRLGFEPGARAQLARAAARAGSAGCAASGPLAIEESWAHVRVDSGFARTFWIARFPSTGVDELFLAPLLVRTSALRSVALICEPVAPARALRDAEAAVTREEAARSQSEKAGFVETTRRRMRADAVSERERELADGHALLRFSGYVTVHAETLEGLDRRSATTPSSSPSRAC